MVIKFNDESLVNFLSSSSEKHVLILKNNTLNIVPISETNLLDRLSATFGFGPLNLNSIAKFISKNVEQINFKIKDSTQQATFYEKLRNKCTLYNTAMHRFLSFTKICCSALQAIDKQIPMCGFAIAQKDQTYHGDGKGNVDFSYANKKLGLGYVVDGSGHNHPLMKEVLGEILDKFNRSYEQEFTSRNFEGIASIKEFLKSKLINLGETIKENNQPIKISEHKLQEGNVKKELYYLKDYLPGMSLAQVVKINDQHHLLSIEFSDTALIIKKADGSFDTSLLKKRDNFGVGDVRGKNVEVRVTEIGPGDQIIGFSDGIGEFLTLDEWQEVVKNTKDTEHLLGNFKEKILSKKWEEAHQNWLERDDEKERDRFTEFDIGKHQENIESVNKNKFIKYCEPFSEEDDRVDDISLFILTV
jgi:hypothetical protein